MVVIQRVFNVFAGREQFKTDHIAPYRTLHRSLRPGYYMAEAVVLAGIGAAATASSQWIGPSTFTARHEESQRKKMGDIQLYNDRWYNIPDQEVDSDEEKEFQSLRNEAQQKGSDYGSSISDFKQTSVFNPVDKIQSRHQVRKSKRETHRSLNSLESYVRRVSYRSQANSRASSRARAGSEASRYAESIIGTTDSPPDLYLRNENILEWSHGLSPNDSPLSVPSILPEPSDDSELNALRKTLVSLEAGGVEAFVFKRTSTALSHVIHALDSYYAHVIFLNVETPFVLEKLVCVGFQTTFLEVTNLSKGSEDERKLMKALHDEQKGPAKMIWMQAPSGTICQKSRANFTSVMEVNVPALRIFLDVHFVGHHESRPYILVDHQTSLFYCSPLLFGADITLSSLTTETSVLSILTVPASTGSIPSPASGNSFSSTSKCLNIPYPFISPVPDDDECNLARREAAMMEGRMKDSGLNALSIARALGGDMDRIDSKIRHKWIKEVVYPGYIPRSSSQQDKKAQVSKEIKERAKRRAKIAWETMSPDAVKWICGLHVFHGVQSQFPSGNVVSVSLRPTSKPFGTVYHYYSHRIYPTMGLQTNYGILKLDAHIKFCSFRGFTNGVVITDGIVTLTVPTGDWQYFLQEFQVILKHLYETHEWEERLKEVSSSTYLWDKNRV
ncbi:hypothetical protein BDP27DRAFT_720538 [Rhodocollybia butyracea]|uniref:Uncharacterized protein n=1 Tax=Rhodocollybia butyracea TaxID=206335 RepID=A0A9P5PP69_9AGAR|nr:hypothetical protein BDP27DRAFT_720538 [Rhodocollybia butyracea]